MRAFHWCKFLSLLLLSGWMTEVTATTTQFSLQDLKDGLTSRSIRYSMGCYKFSETTFNVKDPSVIVAKDRYEVCKSGDMLRFERIPWFFRLLRR